MNSRRLTRLLYGAESGPDTQAFTHFAINVWRTQIRLVNMTHTPNECTACLESAGKSCEDRQALLQAALTPLVFLLQYWQGMSDDERKKWYSTESLAVIDGEVTKVLDEARDLLNREERKENTGGNVSDPAVDRRKAGAGI